MSTLARTSPARTALALCALLTLTGTALAGCGSEDSDAQASAGTSSSPSGSSSPSTAPSPSASAPATIGGPAAGPAACAADMLTGEVREVPGSSAADGTSWSLVLTNGSADASCTLAGFPGVSYLDANGNQVGAPAARTEGSEAAPITLAPGQSAAAELREAVAQKYGECQVQETASLLVYPPDDTTSLTVAYPSTGCLNGDIELLHVGALQAL